MSAIVRADTALESPPASSPSAILAPDQVAGDYFHVADPVQCDGLMYHFVIEGRYGTFGAYGPRALAIRLKELAAIDTLAHTSKTSVVIESLLRAGTPDAPAIAKLAMHPLGTAVGVPRGIAHLLGGYVAEAAVIAGSIDRATKKKHAAAGQSATAADRTGPVQADAKRYADRYFGVTAAERVWYRKLAVDPYTDNQVLRKAVHQVAKLDATAGFGLKFVSLPRMPHGAQLDRAMDAIYSESPVTLRERRRSELRSFGLSADEVDQFEHTLLLSPTRQSELTEIARSLPEVAGRDELMRHAMTVTSTEELEVFMRSAALLPALHRNHPLAKILSGLRIPAAETRDGELLIAAGIDVLYWTADVPGYEKELRTALGGTMRRNLWIEGTVTPRARAEFEQLGWVVHDRAAGALTQKTP